MKLQVQIKDEGYYYKKQRTVNNTTSRNYLFIFFLARYYLGGDSGAGVDGVRLAVRTQHLAYHRPCARLHGHLELSA